MFYRLVLSIFLCGGADALAQVQRPALRTMTLPEALSFAATHQPSLVASRARLAASQQETRIPRGLWLPRAGAVAEFVGGSFNNTTTSYLGTTAMDIPRIGSSKTSPPVSWSPYANTLAGIGIRQEIFDFGRIGALETVYDAAAEAEAANADADKLDVALFVQEGYFGVFVAKAVLSAAEGAVQRSTFHKQLAEAGVKSGLRSPIELTRAEAELARFEIGRVRAAGNVEVARSIFAAAVGVPERYLDASGTMPEPAAAPAASTYDAATEKDPAVRRAKALTEQQRGATRVAKAELLPDLQLTAGLNTRGGGANPSSGEAVPGGGWIPEIPNWDVGVVLSWPLFDASSLARIKASREREAQRAAEADLTKQVVLARVEVADETFRVSIESLPALQRASDAAQANYAQADARFKAGLGNAVELADSEALRLEAEINLAVGKFEQARARSRLARALAEGL
jgi:outer membrane protein